MADGAFINKDDTSVIDLLFSHRAKEGGNGSQVEGYEGELVASGFAKHDWVW